MTPTKIYAKSIVNLLKKFKVNGLCHITGGGIYENVPRVLGDDVDAKIIEKIFLKRNFFTSSKMGRNFKRRNVWNF